MEATFVNKEMFQYQKQAYWEGVATDPPMHPKEIPLL